MTTKNSMHRIYRKSIATLCATLLLSAPFLAHAEAPQVASHAATDPANANLPIVDLNRASVTDFEQLPGIGPAKAQRIIEYRERTGRFQRVEDIMRVKGIGRATLKRLRPVLTVSASGPSTKNVDAAEVASSPRQRVSSRSAHASKPARNE